MLSRDDVLSILRCMRLSASWFLAVFSASSETSALSQAMISTEPLTFSTRMEPLASSGYVWANFSVTLAEAAIVAEARRVRERRRRVVFIKEGRFFNHGLHRSHG